MIALTDKQMIDMLSLIMMIKTQPRKDSMDFFNEFLELEDISMSEDVLDHIEWLISEHK